MYNIGIDLGGPNIAIGIVEKNYKYGLISFNGDIILAPIAQDIYMPKPNLLKILYDSKELKRRGILWEK